MRYLACNVSSALPAHCIRPGGAGSHNVRAFAVRTLIRWLVNLSVPSGSDILCFLHSRWRRNVIRAWTRQTCRSHHINMLGR